MVKKLFKNICQECKEKVEDLYDTEDGRMLCGDCYATDFLKTFDENDDSLFEEAIKTGNVRIVTPETKPVTIRMNVVDIHSNKRKAKEKGMPYQTLIKNIIHEHLG